MTGDYNLEPEGSLRDDTELSLTDYLEIFKRQKLLIVGIVTSMIIAAMVYGKTVAPSYNSTASVVVRTQRNQQSFPSVGRGLGASFFYNPTAELEFMRSDAYMAAAQEAAPTGVTVRPNYDDSGEAATTLSSEITFVATSLNAADAEAGANAWATTYIVMRQTMGRAEVEATLTELGTRIDELEEQKANILEPLEPINAAMASETDSDTIARLTTQRLLLQQSLDSELNPVQAELQSLISDVSSLRIRSGYLAREGISARVNSQAQLGFVAGAPLSRTLMLAAIAGMVLAAAAALLRESLQTRIVDRDGLERAVPGIPILSELPAFNRQSANAYERALGSGTFYVEALDRLVTTLGLLTLGNSNNRILFTSAMPEEGKTTVCTDVAIRLSGSDINTALVDADLRRPSMHQLLEVPNDRPGFSAVLSGSVSVDEALRVVQYSASSGVVLISSKNSAHSNRLDVLLSGPPTTSAASLIRTSQTGNVLSRLGRSHQLVVVDSPPVLPVSDAEAMAAISVDHVVLVVRAGKSTRPEVAEAVRRLRAAGKAPAGIVLTEAKRTVSTAYATTEKNQKSKIR